MVRTATTPSYDLSQWRFPPRDRAFNCTIVHEKGHTGTGRVGFEVDLQPGERWQTCLLYTLEDGAARFSPAGWLHSQSGKSQHGEMMAEWLQTVAKIQTSNEEFYRMFRRALEDMAALRFPIEVADRKAFMPAAGLPWFVAPFGRDALIVSLQNILIYGSVAGRNPTSGSSSKLASTHLEPRLRPRPTRSRRVKARAPRQRCNSSRTTWWSGSAANRPPPFAVERWRGGSDRVCASSAFPLPSARRRGDGGEHSAHVLQRASPDRSHDRRGGRGGTRHAQSDQRTGWRAAARENRCGGQPPACHRCRRQQARGPAWCAHTSPCGSGGLRTGGDRGVSRSARRQRSCAHVVGRALCHRRRQPHSRLRLRPHRRSGAIGRTHQAHRRRRRKRAFRQPRRSGLRGQFVRRPPPRQRRAHRGSPPILVIMGVSGSGKSTIAEELAGAARLVVRGRRFAPS